MTPLPPRKSPEPIAVPSDCGIRTKADLSGVAVSEDGFRLRFRDRGSRPASATAQLSRSIIIEPMKLLTRRFVFRSTLLTVGVALMIIFDGSILSSYGLGLFLLSNSYSVHQKGELPSIWWLVALTVLCGVGFLWDLVCGVAFPRRPIPAWLATLFVAVWAFGIAIEFRGWLLKRRLPRDA